MTDQFNSAIPTSSRVWNSSLLVGRKGLCGGRAKILPNLLIAQRINDAAAVCCLYCRVKFDMRGISRQPTHMAPRSKA